MFSKIMVPVDLAHIPSLRKALQVTGDCAKTFNIPVAYVGVTAGTPGVVGHNPTEYGAKLDAFGAEQARAHGIKAETKTIISKDPVVDVDDVLLKAVGETGADLVIMASHVPGLVDYIWPSNGGKIAAHSAASVFVVRD